MPNTDRNVTILIAIVGLLAAGSLPAAMHAGLTDADFGLDVPMKRYSDEEEALYEQRFEALAAGRMTGEGLKTYDIMEPVPGAADHEFWPVTNSPTIPAETLAAARDYAAANNSSALMIWQGGELQLAEYFGDTRPDTLIVSRSLAKPVTVQAVGRAIRLGKIDSLDQSVADYIDEWQGSDKAKIRVRYLLDMRSGLLPQAPAMQPESILNRAYLHPRHDDIIINRYPLRSEPGSVYEYSNATSDLVAVLIERATERRYSEWVSDEVLSPIGAPGGEVWTTRVDGLAHAGCCILLPAEAYLRMAVLLINDGVWEGKRLLPEGFVEQVRTPTPQNIHAGMGAYIGQPYVERRGAASPVRFPDLGTYHSEPYLAEDLYLYDGNSNQVAYIVPSRELIILRTGTAPPKEPEWDNAHLPNLVLRAMGAGEVAAR
jgi:CubicO group peptidase (beta-lactamase class C family)